MKPDSTTSDLLPRIIIVGGGFGGLAAARELKKARARVGLIDKTNHHVFQPLLYQVATGILTPEHIAAPLRHVLCKQANTTVLKETVIGVDAEKKLCVVQGAMAGAPVSLPYDYLVLATGVQHSYFGHDEYAPFAPGLKTIADADHLRNRILGAFENCECMLDPKAHPELLTFVIVGAGPTGVELAGAIAELAHLTLASEFRRFAPTSLRILLIEAAPPHPAAVPRIARGRREGQAAETGGRSVHGRPRGEGGRRRRRPQRRTDPFQERLLGGRGQALPRSKVAGR